jgi:PAS domain S-box-containing protein
VKKKRQDSIRDKASQLTELVENLRQLELRYRTVPDFTYDWEFWTDPDGKFIYVSPESEWVSGYKASEFINDPSLLVKIILPEDKGIWNKHHQEVYKTLKPGEIQFRIKDRKGEIKWIEHSCKPVRSPWNEFLGFRSNNSDITRRKEIENALRKSENSLADAQRITHIGNWDWNIETNILYWSDEVYRIFGLKPQEFGATYEAFLASIHPHDRESVMDAVNQALADPEYVYSIAHRVIRQDGSERFVHERGEVTFNENGKAVRMIGTVQDITEQRYSEEVNNLSRRFFDISYSTASKQEILDQIVAEIQRFTECEAVGIRILDKDYNIPYEAYVGFSRQFYESESPLSIKSDQCMCINVIKGNTDHSLPFFTERGSFYTNSTTHLLATVSEKDKGKTRNVCNAMGYESVSLIPIFQLDQKIGLFHVADTRENMFSLHTIRVLEGVSELLGTIIWRTIAESELRENEKKYRSLYTHLNEGLALKEIVYDEKGKAVDYKILDFNPAFATVTGIEAEKAVGSLGSEIYGIEGLKKLEIFVKVVQTGEATKFDDYYPLIKKHFLISVFSPEKGKFVTVFTDITERKRMEEKIKQQLEEIKILKSQLEKENIYLREEIKLQYKHEEIIGQSSAIKKVLKQIEQVAPTDSAVFITGETGTGKEIIARTIHNLSKRKDRVMTIVNCASLPPALVESELFGREKGAYTGALSKQIGRFEQADNSTILLDEIGELSPAIQAKLLRVLESGEFERLGSPKSIRVNVRVIAATNRNLTEEVKKGNFREDLFYRLNVFPIEIPPLRERREDIPLLVRAFSNEFAVKMGKRIQSISRKTMETVTSYNWPGNIRELRNVIEHAVIISSDETLQVRLPEDLPVTTAGFQTLNQNEYQYITKVLEKTNWRIKGNNGAAVILGIKPSSLYSKMKRLGIPTRRNKDDIST